MARIWCIGIFILLSARFPALALAAPKVPLAEFHGTLKSIAKNKILVVTGEDQVIVFHRDKRTRFLIDGKEIKADAVPSKSPVTVQAAPTPWGDPDAINVIVGKK
ncbi:MAG TPA: hypothetical protein VKV15_13520 [Bryobacteraceae bacterium]|nr:hypothetical protein [Bryobacteraceae bacterium]